MTELRKLIEDQLHECGLLWYEGVDLKTNFARMIKAVSNNKLTEEDNEDYKNGYDDGYSEGHSDGYNKGYSDGLMKD